MMSRTLATAFAIVVFGVLAVVWMRNRVNDARQAAELQQMTTAVSSKTTVHTINLPAGERLESVTWQCTQQSFACRPWTITRPFAPGETPRSLTVRTPVSDPRLGDKTYVFVESEPVMSQ
jgi:hypothetical protein